MLMIWEFMTVKIVSIDIENSCFIEEKLGGDLTRIIDAEDSCLKNFQCRRG